MSDKIIKKNQFQIRKVPIKKFTPLKVQELYGYDIHTIGKTPIKRKNIDLPHLNCDITKSYHQDNNDRIMYSHTYQQLYLRYCALKQQRQKQKLNLQSQIDEINQKIQKEQKQKLRLNNMKDKLYTDIQNYREQLTQYRNKNYNLRWEIYHQRGGYYINSNHYSFFQNDEPTYQDYLLLEEQIGSVPKGLNQIQLALLPKIQYTISKEKDQNPENQEQNFTKQICCICYDDINQGQYITILKCNHMHHCQCIKDWLIKQKNCPICKKQVVLDDFHLKKPDQYQNNEK